MGFSDYHERVEALSLLPKRVQVLLAAQWAKATLHVFTHQQPNVDGPKLAILAAEAWAYNPNTGNRAKASAALSSALAASISIGGELDTCVSAAAYATSYAAAYAASLANSPGFAARIAGFAFNAGSQWNWLEQTYKHALGPNALGPNALGPNVSFSEEWKTTTVVALASLAKKDMHVVPILADALQDAGCPEEYLSHLKHDDGNITIADWCLWNLTLAGSHDI